MKKSATLLIGIAALAVVGYFCREPSSGPTVTPPNITPKIQASIVLPSQTARGIPLEDDALMAARVGLYELEPAVKTIDALVAFARSNDYRCNSVSSFDVWMFSKGYTLKCNKRDYIYDFADRGKGFVITAR